MTDHKATSGSELMEAVVPDAGAVLHTLPEGQRSVVIFLAGLGTTKEKMGWGIRRKEFEAAGHAVVLADHYNEGARRDHALEAEANRAGWSRCQKDLFWRAIHRTALTVPLLVNFALTIYGADVAIFGYGASMGGDIFLTSLFVERRFTGVFLERSTPDWLRPNSTANVLGECTEGDSLYDAHCPCNRIDEFVDHPTAIYFLCGENDTHVPKNAALAFEEGVKMRRKTQLSQGGNSSPSVCSLPPPRTGHVSVHIVPSRGWENHVLTDPADATKRALVFFAEGIATVASACKAPTTSSRHSPLPAEAAISSAPLRLSPPIMVSADDFRSVLMLATAPFVCVWATAAWCVPCKRLQPGWNAVAEPDGEQYESFSSSVAFAVADLTNESDENLGGESLSEVLRIATLPSFVLFRDGSEIARAEGAAHKRPARRLFDMLKKYVYE